MVGQQSSTNWRAGRVRDARGRLVSQMDPVRLYLLKRRCVIPAETLWSIAEQVMPGVRRQRLVQVVSIALGILVVVGGNIVYFGYFSNWKGIDPVLGTIYAVQATVILGAPLIAYRVAKNRYAHRVARVMLQHRRCPHCGYDIRWLPTDADSGVTTCPECGCAWKLHEQGNR